MTTDLTQYPAADRAAYLGAIAALLTADRQASDSEVQFLSALAQESGLSQADAQQVVDAAMDPNSDSLKQSLDVLKRSELRFTLMHDLVAFAQSDGDYNEMERERVASMAKYLGISTEQQQAVDQYQKTAAQGGDPGPLDALMSQLGMPKGGGGLSALLATVGPVVLQQLMQRRGGVPSTTGLRSSGGGGDLLNQVMGMLGGQGSGSTGGRGGMGGLDQILGALGGGRPVPSRPVGGESSAGGYGAISGLLGRLFG